jgi:hypothetical protein
MFTNGKIVACKYKYCGKKLPRCLSVWGQQKTNEKVKDVYFSTLWIPSVKAGQKTGMLFWKKESYL